MTLREQVRQTIQRERLLSPGTAVVVGLSGGADSVTLLHVLLSLREELDLGPIHAVHVNHLLRCGEADRDEAFVSTLCKRWQVPLSLYQYDIRALAQQSGKGLEETGREWRYRSFNEVADRYTVVCIATAHTASDNEETLLLHLCRGCGLHGLTGIPPIRGRIIRPLLNCSRNDIESYCREQGLSWVHDSTNDSCEYARNRVRHEVLPALRRINPEVDRALIRLIVQARETDRLVTDAADAVLAQAQTGEATWEKAILVQTDTALLPSVLARLFSVHGVMAEETHIRRALALLSGTGMVDLPGGFRLIIGARTVSLKDGNHFCFPESVSVTAGEKALFGSEKWSLTILNRGEYEQKLNISKFLFQSCLDYDKIDGNLTLTPRRAGDRYHPVGRGCGKTLKKLFNEAGLEMEIRLSVPVLRDDSGILLVPGYGCDERVCIDEGSRTILLLEQVEDTQCQQ